MLFPKKISVEFDDDDDRAMQIEIADGMLHVRETNFMAWRSGTKVWTTPLDNSGLCQSVIKAIDMLDFVRRTVDLLGELDED